MAQNTTFDNSAAGGGAGTTSVNYNTDRQNGGSRGFQVGSTYKVFTLINWLQSGHGLNEVVNANGRTVQQSAFTNTCANASTGGSAANGPFGGSWEFKNSSGERGSRTVMAATAASINGAYVTMGLELDQCTTKEIAESLGVHTANNIDNPETATVENELGSNPSAILGTNAIAPLTMAAAYAAIANKGTYCAPIAIDSITDAAGTVLPGQAQTCNAAISPEIAATVAYALEGAMDGYGGNPRDGTPIFGKTGTTDDFDQTWLVSSTTAVTTAVWFGNVSGKYAISKYPDGINNRHIISKQINTAADTLYAGGEFDEAPRSMISGAGVTLPDFVGGAADNAAAIVKNLGLSYSDGGRVDSELAAGTVVRTEPAAGSTLSRGQTVTVYTSNGALTAVPDVVGAATDFATASQTLASAGFTSVSSVCVAVGGGGGLQQSASIGQVVSSNPAAGTVVRPTDEIRLGVAQTAC